MLKSSQGNGCPLNQDQRDRVYSRIKQGAILRAGTGLLMLGFVIAVLIAYLGVITPSRFLFVTAGFSAASLSMAVALEYYGVIPHMDPFGTPPIPGFAQILAVLACSCLLFAIAFITFITGKQLKINWKKLRETNDRLGEETRERQRIEEELGRPMNFFEP